MLTLPTPNLLFLHPPSLTRLNPLLRARADACKMFQHSKSVEISWLNRLQRHPWRVTDPEEAIVFVVPGKRVLLLLTFCFGVGTDQWL